MTSRTPFPPILLPTQPHLVNARLRKEETMSSSATQKRDHRQKVTEGIIKMLEEATAPWQKPWRAGSLEMPFNPITGKLYRGGNAVHLFASAMTTGSDDPRWMTYKQAEQRGWQVR